MEGVYELLGGPGAGPEALIVASLPIGCVLLLFALFAPNERAPLVRRIDRVRVHHGKRAPGEATVSIARTKAKTSDIAFLDDLIRRYIPRQDMLRLRIERAGMSFSIGVYVLTSLLIVFIEGLVYQNLEVKQVNAYYWAVVGILASLARRVPIAGKGALQPAEPS